jgi:hypothetical protein
VDLWRSALRTARPTRLILDARCARLHAQVGSSSSTTKVLAPVEYTAHERPSCGGAIRPRGSLQVKAALGHGTCNPWAEWSDHGPRATAFRVGRRKRRMMNWSIRFHPGALANAPGFNTGPAPAP